MAYAAISSLLQTIDILLDYHPHSISPLFKNQSISILEHTCSLQSFIEGSSDRVNNWEETIRQVTNKAEDIIELLLSDSLLESAVGSSRSELEKGECEVHYSFDELQNVREEIESIASKVKGRRRIETDDGSNDEVMEIISLLGEGSSSLEIIKVEAWERRNCQLEAIGKTIARSCGGHRRSVVVVSGILASDQTEAAWGDVLENIKIAFEEDGDKVDEILYISYMYLPHHLRPCLLYLGIFPEGHVIYVSTLVKMWVAEGSIVRRVRKIAKIRGWK